MGLYGRDFTPAQDRISTQGHKKEIKSDKIIFSLLIPDLVQL
jgi:hypothetical protein